MKRTKRQRTGNLNGKQRRRLAKIMRAVVKGWGPGNWARTPCEMRDAQRLHEAGKVVAVASKHSFIDGRIKEVALFLTMADALQMYPKYCVMRKG